MNKTEIMDYLDKLYKAGLIKKWEKASARDFILNPDDVYPKPSDTLFTVYFPDIENKKYVVFWASVVKEKKDINKIFILTGMEFDMYLDKKRRAK